MKKIFTIFFIIFSTGVIAQNLEFMTGENVAMPDAFTISSVSAKLVNTKFHCKNSGTGDIDIKIKAERISTHYFSQTEFLQVCFGVECYSVKDTAGIVEVVSGSKLMTACSIYDDIKIAPFLQGWNLTGNDSVTWRITIFDANDPNDSVSTIVTWQISSLVAGTGDIDNNGAIDMGEIAGDVNKDGQISGKEIAGDLNGTLRIKEELIGGRVYSELVGDVDGSRQIDGTEVLNDNDGDGLLAGDIDGNSAIDNAEIAGDVNKNGSIDNMEIAGDVSGNGMIDMGETAGDVSGNLLIGGSEIIGDVSGNFIIDNGEIEDDESGDKIKSISEDCLLRSIEDDIEEVIQFSVSPNPTKGSIKINHTMDNVTNPTIVVYNILGSVLISKQINMQAPNTWVNLERYNSGVYFIVLKSNTAILKTAKVILQ